MWNVCVNFVGSFFYDPVNACLRVRALHTVLFTRRYALLWSRIWKKSVDVVWNIVCRFDKTDCLGRPGTRL